MKKIVILDTWINNANLGNKIIFESVHSIALSMFPDSFIYQVSALEYVNAGQDLLRKADYIFLAGTNQLSSDMNSTSEWCAEPEEDFWQRKVILFGVGWWQYQDFLPNEYTQRLLRNTLSASHHHSVRDSYTADRLQNLGFKAYNTGCPTLWSLTTEHCKKISYTKSDSVVLTFTEYNQKPEFDRELFEIVSNTYSKIYFWPQQYLDYFYAKEICGDRIEFVNPSTEAFDDLLMNVEVDYIGTRLHAGIRALQKGRRSLIISVDNRAQEISKNFRLPVLLREDISSRLHELINSSWETLVNIDECSGHKEWINQFLNTDAKNDEPTNLQPIYVGRWFTNQIEPTHPKGEDHEGDHKIQKIQHDLDVALYELTVLRQKVENLTCKNLKKKENLKRSQHKVKSLQAELNQYQEMFKNSLDREPFSSSSFLRLIKKNTRNFLDHIKLNFRAGSVKKNINGDVISTEHSSDLTADNSPKFSCEKELVINSILEYSLTYLDFPALEELYDQVSRIEQENIDGVLIEAGCALGGSAIAITSAKSTTRPLLVYDVFGMIPPPSEKDEEDVHSRYNIIQSGVSDGIGGQKYYGYEDNLIEKVKNNFKTVGFPLEENNVQLIKGLFQDTLTPVSSIALAHIDGDWYESVKVCLERIEPWLALGGVLVIDDYYHWSGCRKAVDEYFLNRQDNYEFIQKSRLHIIRRS